MAQFVDNGYRIRPGHTLRIHLQGLDVRAKLIHHKPDPPDAGTEHLVCNGHKLIISKVRKKTWQFRSSLAIKKFILVIYLHIQTYTVFFEYEWF